MISDNDSHCQHLRPDQECYALREALDKLTEVKGVLSVAAKALDIASGLGVDEVQVNPPTEWELEAYTEDPDDGWCSTSDLADKLRSLVESIGRSPLLLRAVKERQR